MALRDDSEKSTGKRIRFNANSGEGIGGNGLSRGPVSRITRFDRRSVLSFIKPAAKLPQRRFIATRCKSDSPLNYPKQCGNLVQPKTVKQWVEHLLAWEQGSSDPKKHIGLY